jgi:hypothetical protein
MIIFQDYYPRLLSMCEAEGKSLCMIHLQHDDTVAMSQQVRVHRLKISIQEDVLFLLAMSQQVRGHWLKISIQGDVLFLLTHLFKDHVSFCHHLVFIVCCMSYTFTFKSSHLKPPNQIKQIYTYYSLKKN